MSEPREEVYSTEVEYLAKVMEWVESAPEKYGFYVHRVEIYLEDSFHSYAYTGDEARIAFVDRSDG